MRQAWYIFCRDIEDALRNSTFLFVLVGPVVCSVLFFRVSRTEDFIKPKLGIVGSRQEGLGLILSTSGSVVVESFTSYDAADRALQRGGVDGIIELDHKVTEQILNRELPILTLKVKQKDALKATLLRRAIEEAGRTVADQELPIDLEVSGSELAGVSKGWSRGLLPQWLVFTAMSALMLVSASFIEEKEQRTLLGVLTAPVSMVEIWLGKVAAGFSLAFLSTIAVLIGNSVVPSPLLLLHVAVGCLSFAAMGILVGLICSNQSAANAVTSTLFMVIYIPLALQEVSSLLSRVAILTPAYYLQHGSQAWMAGQVRDGAEDLVILLIFFLGLSGAGLWLARQPRRIFPG